MSENEWAIANGSLTYQQVHMPTTAWDHIGYTYYTSDGIEYPSPVSWQEITAMIKALWNEEPEPEIDYFAITREVSG